MKLTITGMVERFAVIEPSRLSLRGEIGEALESQVVITPQPRYPFKVLKVKSHRSDQIAVTLADVDPTEGAYVIEVKNLVAAQKRYTDVIEIETDSEVNPKLYVRVTGVIEPRSIAVIKPKAIWLQGKVGRSLQQTVKIIPKDKYPFKIIAITAQDGKEIRHSWKQVEENDKSYYLLVVENQRNAVGRYRDILTIKTDNEVQPELKIRVTGNILEETG
jgi:hypothetical protein